MVKRSRHTLPVKTGSRSLTMEAGNPWRRTTPSKNARATETAVYGCPNGMKWAYLEKRSTTVRMTDFPWTLGSPSMKSIEMSAHTWDGTSSGCSRPAGGNVSVLFRWQVAQDRTQSWTRARSCGR
jgi:hypothetical protein